MVVNNKIAKTTQVPLGPQLTSRRQTESYSTPTFQSF